MAPGTAASEYAGAADCCIRMGPGFRRGSGYCYGCPNCAVTDARCPLTVISGLVPAMTKKGGFTAKTTDVAAGAFEVGATPRRIRLELSGAVQGVGFRPFVHRLAVSEGLVGFVRNTRAGVSLEVEGPDTALDRFLARLDAELTPPARIEARRADAVKLRGETVFAIAPSAGTEGGAGVVLPDLAPCADCLAELGDPSRFSSSR